MWIPSICTARRLGRIALIVVFLPMACAKLGFDPAPEASVYSTVAGARAAADTASNSLSQLLVELQSISPSDPEANEKIADLADDYSLDELKSALDILLSNPSVNASLKAQIRSVYDRLFGRAWAQSVRAATTLESNEGLHSRLQDFLLLPSSDQIETAIQQAASIQAELERLRQILIGILGGLLPPVAAPPVLGANPPGLPPCVQPGDDASCTDHEAYHQCLEDQRRADCERTCVTRGRRYISRCQAIPTSQIVSSCVGLDGSTVGIQIPTHQYICSRIRFPRRWFGSPQCPAGHLDPNSSTTSCAGWDALKTCLENSVTCVPPLQKVIRYMGYQVPCTEPDGTVGYRQVGYFTCSRFPQRPEPGVPGVISP